MMTLAQMNVGETAVISRILGTQLTNKFFEMGLLPGAVITFTIRAPLGDPICLRVLGYELALRCNEASMILVRDVHSPNHEKTTNSPSREA